MTVPADYYRPTLTTTDRDELHAVAGQIAAAQHRLGDLADRLRDTSTVDPDTGEHPFTDEGRAVADLLGRAIRLAEDTGRTAGGDR